MLRSLYDFGCFNTWQEKQASSRRGMGGWFLVFRISPKTKNKAPKTSARLEDACFSCRGL
jgi:hypothetical protein